MTHAACDSDGWTYTINFNDFDRRESSAQAFAFNYVRRRRWVRERIQGGQAREEERYRLEQRAENSRIIQQQRQIFHGELRAIKQESVREIQRMHSDLIKTFDRRAQRCGVTAAALVRQLSLGLRSMTVLDACLTNKARADTAYAQAMLNIAEDLAPASQQNKPSSHSESTVGKAFAGLSSLHMGVASVFQQAAGAGSQTPEAIALREMRTRYDAAGGDIKVTLSALHERTDVSRHAVVARYNEHISVSFNASLVREGNGNSGGADLWLTEQKYLRAACSLEAFSADLEKQLHALVGQIARLEEARIGALQEVLQGCVEMSLRLEPALLELPGSQATIFQIDVLADLASLWELTAPLPSPEAQLSSSSSVPPPPVSLTAFTSSSSSTVIPSTSIASPLHVAPSSSSLASGPSALIAYSSPCLRCSGILKTWKRTLLVLTRDHFCYAFDIEKLGEGDAKGAMDLLEVDRALWAADARFIDFIPRSTGPNIYEFSLAVHRPNLLKKILSLGIAHQDFTTALRVDDPETMAQWNWTICNPHFEAQASSPQ
jgi:hypothetical protein